MNKCKKVVAMVLSVVTLVSTMAFSASAKPDTPYNIAIQIQQSSDRLKKVAITLLKFTNAHRNFETMNDLQSKRAFEMKGLRLVTRTLKKSNISFSNLTKLDTRAIVTSTHTITNNPFIESVALVEVDSKLCYAVVAGNQIKEISALDIDDRFSLEELKKEYPDIPIAESVYNGHYYLAVPVLKDEVKGALLEIASFIKKHGSTTTQEKINKMIGNLIEKEFKLEEKILTKLEDWMLRKRQK